MGAPWSYLRAIDFLAVLINQSLKFKSDTGHEVAL